MESKLLERLREIEAKSPITTDEELIAALEHIIEIEEGYWKKTVGELTVLIEDKGNSLELTVPCASPNVDHQFKIHDVDNFFGDNDDQNEFGPIANRNRIVRFNDII